MAASWILLLAAGLPCANGAVESVRVEGGRDSAGFVVTRRDGGREMIAVSLGRPGHVVPPRGANAPVPWPGLSRLLAAYAVLQLVDHRIVALSDPVQRYVPELARGPFRRAPTVADLLFQTAGISPSAVVRGDPEGDVRRHGPPVREPGRVTAPSPLGDELLALVVRRTTGRPLAAFVHENLAGPLGLRLAWRRTGGRLVPLLPPSDVVRLFSALMGLGYHDGVALWSERTGRFALAVHTGHTAGRLGAMVGGPTIRWGPGGPVAVFRIRSRGARLRLHLQPAARRFVVDLRLRCRRDG